MRLPRFFVPVALVVIGLAAWFGYRSSTASPAPLPPARNSTPTATQSYRAPALWKVSDADTTIYLFGTFHMLPPASEGQWFKGALRQAFDRSDVLVTEIISPANPMELAPATVALATDPDGPPLSQKLPPEARSAYQAFVRAQDMRPESLERFEAWYVASLLATARYRKIGLDPKSGAERVLIAALPPTKKREALETPQAQLAMLDSVPESEQIDALVQLVTSKGDPRASTDKMFAQWVKGDAEGLAASKNAALYKMQGMSRIMLSERNRRWAAWIKERLGLPGTYFVAVGGSHLAGPNSVQHYLAQDHRITAQRVPD